jgi:hypothetical protein
MKLWIRVSASFPCNNAAFPRIIAYIDMEAPSSKQQPAAAATEKASFLPPMDSEANPFDPTDATQRSYNTLSPT